MRVVGGAGFLLVAGCAAPLLGRIQGEIGKHFDYFERRLVTLLPRIPAERYGWRPAEGVRSVREVALHIAGTNFLVAVIAGEAPVPGIDPDGLERIVAEPTRILELVRASFARLRAAIERAPGTRLDAPVSFHGRPIPLREVFLKTAMHASEHLGQLVAYARILGVRRVP